MTPAARRRTGAGLLVLAVVLASPPAGATQEVRPRALTGRVLVAAPGMRDPRFARTVVYLVQHGPDGAMGLIVNRPFREVPLERVFKGLGTERAFVLHTGDYTTEGTLAVSGAVSVTTSPEILKAIAAGKGPRRHLFAFGYAGWAAGQLEGELARGDWVTAAADEALLFDDDHAAKWQRASARTFNSLLTTRRPWGRSRVACLVSPVRLWSSRPNPSAGPTDAR